MQLLRISYRYPCNAAAHLRGGPFWVHLSEKNKEQPARAIHGGFLSPWVYCKGAPSPRVSNGLPKGQPLNHHDRGSASHSARCCPLQKMGLCGCYRRLRLVYLSTLDALRTRQRHTHKMTEVKRSRLSVEFVPFRRPGSRIAVVFTLPFWKPVGNPRRAIRPTINPRRERTRGESELLQINPRGERLRTDCPCGNPRRWVFLRSNLVTGKTTASA